eukprot:Rmarinus@m.25990
MNDTIELPISSTSLHDEEETKKPTGCFPCICCGSVGARAVEMKEMRRAIARRILTARKKYDHALVALTRLHSDENAEEDLLLLFKQPRSEYDRYIPQFCNFLLFGPSIGGSSTVAGHRRTTMTVRNSKVLEQELLLQCGISLRFGIAVTWYLNSLKGQPSIKQRTVALEHARLTSNVAAAIVVGPQPRPGSHADEPEVHEESTSAVDVTDSSPKIKSAKSLLKSIRKQKSLFKHMKSSLTSLTSSTHLLLEDRSSRQQLYHSELDFVNTLTDISELLRKVPRAARNDCLKKELQAVNEQLPAEVWIPTLDRDHVVMRGLVDEARVFSTHARAPYLFCVEVCYVRDEEHTSSMSRGQRTLREIMSKRRKRSKRARASASSSISSIGASGTFVHPKTPLMRKQASESDDEESAKLHDSVRSLPSDAMDMTDSDDDDGGSDSCRERADSGGSGPMDLDVELEARQPDPLVKAAWGEPWSSKVSRIREESKQYASYSGWGVEAVIVKSFDNLIQEQFALQLVAEFYSILHEANLDLWLCPYKVISTGMDCGFIEMLHDAISIDALKKNTPNFTTLQSYFERRYGNPKDRPYRRALRCYVRSLAGYCLVTYILQVKDRHNGNIMVDSEGHVIHIDFGFFLSNSPGKGINFEKAPFKLTKDFVDVLGGTDTKAFRRFCNHVIKGFLALRKRSDKIIMLVEMMMHGNENLPCFAGGREAVIEGLRQRFQEKLTRQQCVAHVQKLIENSIDNWRNRWYDRFQYYFTGIL